MAGEKRQPNEGQKQEPRQDARKSGRNGGYTIPIQMH